MRSSLTKKSKRDSLKRVCLYMEELKIQNKALDIELLKIYYEEWKFRQENLWKRMTSFFIVIFFISTLPVTVHMFSGLIIPDVAPIIFPVCGMVLSAFYLWYCFAESHRINAVDELIKEIIKDNFSSRYAKHQLSSFSTKKKRAWGVFQIRMTVVVPLVLTAFEIAVAIIMIILICKKII